MPRLEKIKAGKPTNVITLKFNTKVLGFLCYTSVKLSKGPEGNYAPAAERAALDHPGERQSSLTDIATNILRLVEWGYYPVRITWVLIGDRFDDVILRLSGTDVSRLHRPVELASAATTFSPFEVTRNRSTKMPRGERVVASFHCNNIRPNSSTGREKRDAENFAQLAYMQHNKEDVPKGLEMAVAPLYVHVFDEFQELVHMYAKAYTAVLEGSTPASKKAIATYNKSWVEARKAEAVPLASAGVTARVKKRQAEREKEGGDYAVHSISGTQGSTFVPSADPKEKETMDAQGKIRLKVHRTEDFSEIPAGSIKPLVRNTHAGIKIYFGLVFDDVAIASSSRYRGLAKEVLWYQNMNTITSAAHEYGKRFGAAPLIKILPVATVGKHKDSVLPTATVTSFAQPVISSITASAQNGIDEHVPQSQGNLSDRDFASKQLSNLGNGLKISRAIKSSERKHTRDITSIVRARATARIHPNKEEAWRLYLVEFMLSYKGETPNYTATTILVGDIAHKPRENPARVKAKDLRDAVQAELDIGNWSFLRENPLSQWKFHPYSTGHFIPFAKLITKNEMPKKYLRKGLNQKFERAGVLNRIKRTRHGYTIDDEFEWDTWVYATLMPESRAERYLGSGTARDFTKDLAQDKSLIDKINPKKKGHLPSKTSNVFAAGAPSLLRRSGSIEVNPDDVGRPAQIEIDPTTYLTKHVIRVSQFGTSSIENRVTQAIQEILNLQSSLTQADRNPKKATAELQKLTTLIEALEVLSESAIDSDPELKKLRREMPHGVISRIKQADPEKIKGWSTIVLEANLAKYEAIGGPSQVLSSVWAPNERVARLIILYRFLRRNPSKQPSIRGLRVPPKAKKFMREIKVGNYQNYGALINAMALSQWAAATNGTFEVLPVAEPIKGIHFQRGKKSWLNRDEYDRTAPGADQLYGKLRRIDGTGSKAYKLKTYLSHKQKIRRSSFWDRSKSKKTYDFRSRKLRSSRRKRTNA